jgi:UDP:flavonoid glycosyltransferase YjiC (YdhE family)
MRIVLSCVSVVSHFYPLAPIARALAAAGHTVVVATGASLAPVVEQAGLRHRPAGFPFNAPEVVEIRAQAHRLRGEATWEFAWGRAFAGLLATRMAGDLLALPEMHAADLVVRDGTELGACVAAERLGLPHAAISTLSAGMTPGADGWIKGPLNTLRAGHGLPADDDVAMPFRYLTVHQAPPSFLSEPLRPTDQLIRPVPFDASDDVALPAWIDTLPARPTVYATLGTVFNGRPEIFRAILDGLRDEPINLIVTVGRDQDPAQFGPQPSHIRIERYIPQSRLLSRCDLVLTHGGSGTTMAALAHGLPLVVVPIGADQPQNAERCAALGAGLVVEAGQAGARALRDAVRTVLRRQSFRQSAGRLRDEIAALPGPDHAVRLLERLADERKPLRSDAA